jgi:hypothetical protein
VNSLAKFLVELTHYPIPGAADSDVQMAPNRTRQVRPVRGELFNSIITAAGGTETVANDLGVNRRHLADLCNCTHLCVA